MSLEHIRAKVREGEANNLAYIAELENEVERLQEVCARASRLAEQERAGLTQFVLQEAFREQA